MALKRATERQEKLENVLLDIGQCDIMEEGPQELSSSLTELLDLTLAAVTYLSLNVRDVIMILNRQNPDSDTGPDGEPVKLGAKVEAGVERSPETQVEPGPESEGDPGAEPGVQDPSR